jgi:hypothetical protein
MEKVKTKKTKKQKRKRRKNAAWDTLLNVRKRLHLGVHC